MLWLYACMYIVFFGAEVNALLAAAEEEIKSADTIAKINEIRRDYLGEDGKLLQIITYPKKAQQDLYNRFITNKKYSQEDMATLLAAYESWKLKLDQAASAEEVDILSADAGKALTDLTATFTEGETAPDMDAAAAAADFARRGLRPDVICVDPPRKGLAPEVIHAAAQMAPKRIVYVSCDPATLARDVKLFAQEGYCAVRAAAVDMFPRTKHVETVCLLSKLQSKEHIEIEVKMDELDLTAAEKKATYEEIREYVFEHTGLKVSHLYIAQVKQKHGIIERENYNKPKSEDTRQPQCPPEKEKAIKEALHHFGMIL